MVKSCEHQFILLNATIKVITTAKNVHLTTIVLLFVYLINLIPLFVVEEGDKYSSMDAACTRLIKLFRKVN